ARHGDRRGVASNLCRVVSVNVDDVCALIRVQLGSRAVRPEDRIVTDLGAESIDVLNIVVAVEERFGVVLDEGRLPAIVTVDDLYNEIRGAMCHLPSTPRTRSSISWPREPSPRLTTFR